MIAVVDFLDEFQFGGKGFELFFRIAVFLIVGGEQLFEGYEGVFVRVVEGD